MVAAILRVLCSCGLHRAQICDLNVSDWNQSQRWLQVQPEPSERRALLALELFPLFHIPLAPRVNEAIRDYLEQAPHRGNPNAPLFGSLSRRLGALGERLTVDGIYYLTAFYGKQSRWKLVSPRTLRLINPLLYYHQ